MEILTSEEAAELFRVSKPYIARMAATGEIPATKLGDDWRFYRADLLDYLRDRARREQHARKTEQPTQTEPTEKRKRGRPREVDIGRAVMG